MTATTTTTAERRWTSVPVETRAKSGDRTIGGYAALFERLSQNLGGFVEEVQRSAFNKSRGDGWPDVLARYNHDDNRLLGTSDARTLRLSVDETGLLYDVDLPASRADVFELVERGDVRQSSFAFVTFEDDWSMTDQGFPKRSLVSVRLVDVAPVNTPAYLDTSVGKRDNTRGVALRSLATKVDAPFDDVLAAEDLRKFLVRTDQDGGAKPKPKTFGPSARMRLLADRDKWAGVV
jgi:HK97 family phage prohead protease